MAWTRRSLAAARTAPPKAPRSAQPVWAASNPTAKRQRTTRAQNENVIDEAELRRMTQDERRKLAHALAAIDLPHPLLDPRVQRRRRLSMLIATVCCVALAGWIVILVFTLPGRFTSSDWRAVWVGLDIAELLGFAATAWAAWHQRQIVIIFMVMTGTLLICDAWFDLALDYGSSGFVWSVLSALLAELPLALLLFAGARRLIRVNVEALMELTGTPGSVPPLRRVPLFADGLEECLPARLRPQADSKQSADVTDRGRPSS